MLITMKHKQKCLQRAKADKVEQQSIMALETGKPFIPQEHDTSYETAFAMLEKHREQLHNITSIDEKVELKKQLVVQYLPFLKSYMKSGAHYQNEVLTELCVWLIDVEDMETALMLAEYAVEQQQISPARYKRDFPSLIAEMICDWSERQYKSELSAHPYLDRIVELVDSEQWLMGNIIIPTKIYKIAALYAERDEDYKTAVELFEKCVEVNPEKHGVKTRLELARKKLTELQAPPTDERADQ